MPDAPGEPPRRRDVDAAALKRIARRCAGQSPWLHDEVARRMAERLSVVRRTPQTVLDWCSRGEVARGLLRSAYAQATLLRVEPIDELRRAPAAGRWSPRRWLAPGRPVLAPDEVAASSAQLVWANMMLHGVADPLAPMRQWQRALQVDGFVMFSTFGPGTLAGLRALYARLGWPAPHAPFVDMHDLGDLLVEAGFADPVMDQETLTLTWADADALLAELRGLGGNAAAQRFAGLRTPRWHERLRSELGGLAGRDGRLALDFEVVYGHAFKGAPAARAGEATQVPLADLRRMLRARRDER
jgi:malonyl-CoA O-methyltransferase